MCTWYTEDMFKLMYPRLKKRHCLSCNIHNSVLELSIIKRYTNAVYYYYYYISSHIGLILLCNSNLDADDI